MDASIADASIADASVSDAGRPDAERPTVLFQVVVPADASLANILRIGYGAGVPKGSARGGCIELQTDDGVWTSLTGGRSTPAPPASKLGRSSATHNETEDDPPEVNPKKTETK